MSNHFGHDGKIAFHPGYYVKEIADESGLTYVDFAKRLNMTPKDFSLLIRGELSLSENMARKLSEITGTSVTYWLNLQDAYNSLTSELQQSMFLKEDIAHIIENMRQVHNEAYNLYSPMVDNACRAVISEIELERLFDKLLDFTSDEKILLLYKKLCKRYFEIYPVCVSEYIHAYREMWEDEDSEE